ncbi:MAG: malonyl-CoA decarboxylase [Halioglobus sp.]|jgi:malonyl-CoA decarboxylase
MSTGKHDTDSPLEGFTGSMSNLERRLSSVIEVGRDLLAKRKLPLSSKARPVDNLVVMCRDLKDHRGEASGLALAGDITQSYLHLEAEERLAFFRRLAEDFDVDSGAIIRAADEYRQDSNLENLLSIARRVEAPRQKLFRRINMAPGGTRSLVIMRGHLLEVLRANPDLRGVDSDLKHLFISWFNKGFLEMRRIDWSSPAMVLEKIIAYEAVHEINGWDDLRNRLREDRRCFAFFHPALENDPLVFVEIAFTSELPDAIAPLLVQDRGMPDKAKVNTVVFYSISNCHPGLSGVSFGNFLIKNVVEELKKEIPELKTFVTLSPVPGFRKWLLNADLSKLVDENMAAKVIEPIGQVVESNVYEALIRLCTHYLLKEKSGELAKDPVARFHLGNGASLHRLHGAADMSVKGRHQSGGIMVNYLYDLGKIEVNHEAYFEKGKISVSKSVSKLLG